MAESLAQLLRFLSPDVALLATGVAADLLLGDPVYAWHPVRLVGALLTWVEGRLRAAGLDGYGGGVLLFVALATISLGVVVALLAAASAASVDLAWVVHAFLLYSLLALGDLLHHVWRIERAVRDNDLSRARNGVSALVGRDTANMDAAACRRAAVESLSENLTDGFVSPLFWYVLAGIPGIVVFKVVSTMDSMVGYKTPRYLQFGWCGARLDDVMNYLPARITWLAITVIAAVLPTFSGSKAWRVGLGQHALLHGPNSGWSEAAAAGALQRRIVGPIWLNGALVTELWIGDASDPPLATSADVLRALALCVLTGLAVAALGSTVLLSIATPIVANPGDTSRMRLTTVFAILATATLAASDVYPPPRFADPGRVTKLQSAMPEIDRLFRAYATDKKVPGMVWGVVIDGQVAHVGSFGVRDRATQAPVTPDTAFRIASMTKSFTALAVLKLRDAGRLSLEDPVSRWIGEFARMERPTRDTPPLTIRHLLSHSAGFPEDNPWGDQQLSATESMLDEWLAKGIPFSTPPGTRYEYSNYAFGLLGRVVTKASGVPYEQYVQTEILSKLHMDATTFRFADVPASRRAVGYRLKPDGTYADEPPLPHGVFGAMGGLLTTAADLGKYVAFHLSAWPPRDDDDAGPVRRASVREMAHLWTPANLTARLVDGKVQASESGYGFGLRVTSDCRFEQIVAHGGGLPGFGSYMAWLPDYGVGMFAMATLTYSGPSEPISQAWDAMLQTGGLRKRELPPTTLQTGMRDHILNLWKRWDDAEAKNIAAVNFFLDAPSAQRQAEIRALKNEVGDCTDAGPVIPENWLRGQFNITCAKGTVGVFFTLAPTQPPAVQHLAFQKLLSPAVRMGAPTGAPAGVSCTR